jgi:putative polyhydroxyalkanoate system protein
MSELTASIPHRLSREDVKQRIREHLEMMRRQHSAVVANIQESWTGDTLALSLTAMGQPLNGRVTVEDDAVRVSLILPWLLRLLSGSIKDEIEKQGVKLLGNQPNMKPGAT